MGQKVHPYGFRLGVTKPWRSRWFVERDYDKLLLEDVKLKAELKDKLKSAGVSSIEIERPGNKLRIIIRTARPGIIIGRKGAEIDKLKGEIQKRTGRDVYVDIHEVHKPELDAQLVAENIALQLEKRVSFRRAMRKAVDSALRFGCKGIKVRVSGRLNGNEIARSEWYLQGRLPLHTLRADIDYGFAEAHTTYGIIGVKCWVYKGEILREKKPRAAGVQWERSKEQLSSQFRVVRRSADSRAENEPLVTDYVDAKESEVPQAAARAHVRQGVAWRRAVVRRLRPEGHGAGLDHRSPDRSQPRGHDAFRQARRQDLDPPVSRQAGDQEAGRNPYGQGQGSSRSLGRRGAAGQDPLRDGRGSATEAAEAMRLASHKLPLRTKFVARDGAN